MIYLLIINTALMIFIFMTTMFLISIKVKKNSIADVAWGLGFIFVAFLNLLIYMNTSYQSLLITTLIFVWGGRLAWHIYLRNKGRTEDKRYIELQKNWGDKFLLNSFLRVFMVQGFFMLLISLTLSFTSTSQVNEYGILNFTGLIVWIIGFYFESTADRQLVRFIKDPKNKGHLMMNGLWRYSRHPNYFGEITMWWGIFLIAFGIDNWILTIISPLTITILITRVSGVPLTEKQFSKYREFKEYKKHTNILIPWFKH